MVISIDNKFEEDIESQCWASTMRTLRTQSVFSLGEKQVAKN